MKSSFVVGCGHSGTSLLVRLLGEHPDIYAIPDESGLFVKNKDPDTIRRILNSFDQQAQDAGRKMWVEKTPKHVHHIEDMLTYRSNSKILGITRDPRDVACSIKGRGFTFEEGLKRWISDNASLLKYKRSKQVFIVKLEDLVEKRQTMLNSILDFLNVPRQDVLNYHKNPQTWYAGQAVNKKPHTAEGDNHVKLRNWQINQPIFSTTRRYDKDMDTADKRTLYAYVPQIQHIAQELGYELG